MHTCVHIVHVCPSVLHSKILPNNNFYLRKWLIKIQKVKKFTNVRKSLKLTRLTRPLHSQSCRRGNFPGEET